MEKGFINLGKRSESISVAEQPAEKESVYYPTLYLNNVDLDIDEEDVGEEMEAVIKVRVKNYTKRIESKKTAASVDLEVTGIKFNE